MNDKEIIVNMRSAYSKLKIDEDFIIKTNKMILEHRDVIYNETKQNGDDVTPSIKHKFVFRPRFILNAIASIIIIAVLINITLFKGVFNKNLNVLGINKSPSNSLITPNNSDKKTFSNSTPTQTTHNNIDNIIIDDGTFFNTIINSIDGGFITIGNRFNGSDSDAVIYKFNNSGNKVWSKSIKDTGIFQTITQTDDGGYIALFKSSSNQLVILYKLDKEGNNVWSKTLDEINVNIIRFNKIIQTTDKNLIIVGLCSNNDEGDALIIKFNNTGSVLWKTIFGGSLYDTFNSVIQLNDGGLLVTGLSDSIDGDLSDKNPNDPGVIVKFDSSGKKAWSQYSSSNYAYADLTQINNNEILVSSVIDKEKKTNSTLTKYSNDGNKLWEINYKESWDLDQLTYILKTNENSIIGISYPYICNFDYDGNVLWRKKYDEKIYGSNGSIYMNSFIQLSNSIYIACGKYFDFEDNNNIEKAGIFFFDKYGNLNKYLYSY